jgi:hypothetical protein
MVPRRDAAEFDRDVRLHVYAHFVEHQRPPTTKQAAAVFGVSSRTVRDAFQRLAAGRALVLRRNSDEVLMAMPFSADPTPFEVTAKGRTWYAACAWDALGVPAMLHSDAVIDTSCGDCGQPLKIEVQSGSVTGSSALIHFAVAAAHWWDDIEFT